MICGQCNGSVELAIDCPCGTTICHECFYQHDCEQKERARLHRPRSESPDQPQRDRPVNPENRFNLRPYQQLAIDAIIETLA